MLPPVLLTVEQIESVKLARRDPGTRVAWGGERACSDGELGRFDADRIDGRSRPAVVVRRLSRGGRPGWVGRGPVLDSGLVGLGMWFGLVWLRWGDEDAVRCRFLNVGSVGEDVDRGDTDGRRVCRLAGCCWAAEKWDDDGDRGERGERGMFMVGEEQRGSVGFEGVCGRPRRGRGASCEVRPGAKVESGEPKGGGRGRGK